MENLNRHTMVKDGRLERRLGPGVYSRGVWRLRIRNHHREARPRQAGREGFYTHSKNKNIEN